MLECHKTPLMTAPGSKFAKRLALAVLPRDLHSLSLVFKAYWTASEKSDPRARADPLDIVCIHKNFKYLIKAILALVQNLSEIRR